MAANENHKNKGEQAIEALLQLPVGRRWVLKVGASLAVAAGLGSLAACKGRSRDYQTALSDMGATDHVTRTLFLVINQASRYTHLHLVIKGQVFPVVANTESLPTTASGDLWDKLDTTKLTHHVTVPFPIHRAQLATVYGTVANRQEVVVQTFLVPESATRTLAEAAFQLTGNYASVLGSPQRLSALELDGAQIDSTDEVIQLDKVIDTYQTAVALTMLHPNVLNRDPLEAAATKSLLQETPEVSTLGSYINQMNQESISFAPLVPAVDAHGQPSEITIQGKDTTLKTKFSTITLNQTDAVFVETARSALIAGMRAVRNSARLGSITDKPLDELSDDTHTWHQPLGMAITPAPYSSISNASVGTTIQNPGTLFGVLTAADGNASGSNVPLTLYNNYMRWVSVYVQYLSADGTNLSASRKPSGLDTHNAKWVGLLPQVFTVMGIPLWDTNTINVSLNFPSEASTARLLFCGLGNEVVGGGWRQYFSDKSYPDHIAPTEEVLLSGLLTGIVSLGVNAFALAADINIAAMWASIRQAIQTYSSDMTELELALKAVFTLGSTITASEALAATVAGGNATYTDIATNHANVSNLWSILGAVATIIPKILFGSKIASQPVWRAIDDAFAEALTAEEIANSIPLIGEVIAVITAVGDAVTLAEAIGETVASPWVFANYVTRTYPTTVTVSHDRRAATWPVTARSWQIQTKIDGMVAATPITGKFNAAEMESGPLVLNLNGAFGGKTITWMIVLLDQHGHQVATGASKQLANNNATSPPSEVAFNITELPAVITAKTVFRRTATTMYNVGMGGYTWSKPFNDTSTRANAGIEEIICISVATRLGVVGVVFKQNAKYWLRGMPLAQNGSVMRMGGATRQGYTRRPFLLFDALVGRADIGNHVLLEPDEVTDGYHVRRLNIDPTTGALSWDASVSLGFFSLPVSAAALHASGHVITVHTNSGRLGCVLPAKTPTPRPPLAAYSAGPGKQIGLLSSPNAVAVTAPGTIIVLEAAASQLSAFDLNGNPVRQFGSGSAKNFTLPLPEPRAYLDVAVDGSGDIYVLSYQGKGANPSQYRIDVFSPTGMPMSTLSTGNNIPHLAVDYWRSIYAANYTPLLDSNGNVYIDPNLGVAEPSISRFDPS